MEQLNRVEIEKLILKHYPKIIFFSCLIILSAVLTVPKNFGIFWMSNTSGYVLKSRVTTSKVDKIYRFNVTYSFHINSKRYLGEKISHNPAERYEKKYPKGKKVDVYYDPENPKFNTLELEWSPFINRFLLILLGLSILGFSIRVKRRSS